MLLWGVLFSSLGVAFFLYGKRQRAVVPLVCGIVLIIFPYFAPNALVMVAVGLVITVIPYFFRM